ncbi:hypothetical protein [Azospira sp. I09]|uniref:hypothetical protein n=1 Tax=Azospira sp. I09 TaxID=1765049 RepID=UPI001260D9F5|nr:hypothetical protein [Azospira sp. I09]BBN90477.1 hypothetical protein AZSP09_35000 [Azospira sp. I09]
MAEFTILVGDEVVRLTKKEVEALRKSLKTDVLVTPEDWTRSELQSRSQARKKLMDALYSAEKDIILR